MMMQTGAQSWEDLRRAARTAERHLEDKIAAYTAISKAAARVATDYDVGACRLLCLFDVVRHVPQQLMWTSSPNAFAVASSVLTIRKPTG